MRMAADRGKEARTGKRYRKKREAMRRDMARKIWRTRGIARTRWKATGKATARKRWKAAKGDTARKKTRAKERNTGRNNPMAIA